MNQSSHPKKEDTETQRMMRKWAFMHTLIKKVSHDNHEQTGPWVPGELQICVNDGSKGTLAWHNRDVHTGVNIKGF